MRAKYRHVGFERAISYISSTKMKMTLLDKSECFRAFLLLIGQDGVITRDERDFLLHIGKMLDFERRFSETAIDDLLENRYINTNPPLFSVQEIAEAFLKDAVRIAFSDKDLHTGEFKWLQSIAVKNGLRDGWLSDEVELCKGCGLAHKETLEIQQYVAGK